MLLLPQVGTVYHDRNYVGKIERGEKNITINSLYRFYKVFGCELTLFREHHQSASLQPA
jgi:transcriptional regulator with XRE-family HTH domain